MKIIVVGGTGIIGAAVVKELSPHHEVITASRRHGDIQVDICDPTSIEKMFKSIKNFDAVVSTTGSTKFDDFNKMQTEDYYIGINNKLMGQVNLVLLGRNYITDGGSFTLTSGVLSDEAIRGGSSPAMIDGAINSFIKTAAIEMPRNIRINAVSPTVIAESLPMLEHFFPGFEAVPVARVAKAYVKSVEGLQTGKIYAVI